ncbi:DUF4258 domain-containing protein [Thermococcus thioreducens]|uniref:DUF4258 domain-containing protein n=1 Tax=Thermococcus thioreducens TaxID=277988 RepID=A0A0Q2UQY1_9EURY|nr:DUF4258 domain-containing protein [Thermococcus thioreducens]ASJ12349.1 hypothetical protein A3L14_05340 [Thermococcus thioreducens]KQH83080.1 hypothetical protein AMR53_02335 [Thermococcus thioreducens]SEV92384.1 protein of unknown function [Thermococcus thioreducens]
MIIREELHERGRIYTISSDGRKCRVLLTFHAIERAKRWNLSIEEVLNALIFPREVVSGHHGRFIAHYPLNDHIIRVVYEYEADLPVVVTVYKPRKERYFKGGGGYEDRVLPRC